MSHEVAHALLARHGAERMSQQMVAQAIGELLAFGVGKVGPGLHDDFLKHYGMGALLEFTAMGTSARIRSRSHWAHSHGKAGYDPATAVAFWERMSKIGGDKPPEFLSTHPSDQTRIAQIKEWLPEAKANFRSK
jgi:predicted Zn-dependent protease